MYSIQYTSFLVFIRYTGSFMYLQILAWKETSKDRWNEWKGKKVRKIVKSISIAARVASIISFCILIVCMNLRALEPFLLCVDYYFSAFYFPFDGFYMDIHFKVMKAHYSTLSRSNPLNAFSIFIVIYFKKFSLSNKCHGNKSMMIWIMNEYIRKHFIPLPVSLRIGFLRIDVSVWE